MLRPMQVLAPVLLAMLLAGPFRVSASDVPAGESRQARITRLEAEERQLRQDLDPVRANEVLRELVDALEGSPRQGVPLLNLYLLERDAGNLAAAAKLRRKILDTPGLHEGVRIGLFFRDAQFRAWIGDIAGARELLKQGNDVVSGLSPRDRIAQRLMHRYLSRQAAAEASILRMEGNLEGASKAIRRALAENEADLKRVGSVADGDPGLFSSSRDRATAEVDRALLSSELIGILVQENRLGAAELAAQEWLLATQREEGQRRHALFARKRYGDVMLALGRCGQALDAFDKVIAGYREQRRSEISTNLVFAKRSRAQTLMCLDRWQEALAGFRELEEQTRGRAARQYLRAGTDRALVRAMTGDLQSAESMIDAAVASLLKSYGPDHAATIMANGLRALILSRLGRDAEAMPLFQRYFAARTATSGDVTQGDDESSRTTLRKRLILEAYLAALSRQAGDPAAVSLAFQVADTLRAGRVQQAIAASAVRGGIADPRLNELVRLEQNQTAELAALYRALGDRSGEDGKDVAADLPDLRPRINALEKQRRETLDEIRRQFPEYERLVRPAPPTPGEVGRLLADSEVMLSIYTAAEASYVFAVSPTRAAEEGATVRLHVAPLGSPAIREKVGKLRAALDIGDIPLGQLPAFDLALAHQLHQQLLEPLRPHWEGAGQLIVSASGALGQLPFSLLVENPVTLADKPPRFSGYADVPWLVNGRAISHVPSAAAFVALRRLPAARAGRAPFVGFGDPDFGAPQTAPGALRNLSRRAAPSATVSSENPLRAAYLMLPPLPDTRDEVLAVAGALKAPPQDAVLGRAASREGVLKRDLSRTAVVAFATHGLQPGELPGLDEPALAMTLPAGVDQSPLLTLSDVLGLRLDADWVLLSACNTAGADGEAAEALSGLGRGFFFAGARAVLVTHWPVESSSARLLVSELFAQPRQSASRAEALRQAQRTLMRKTAGKEYSYAHPLFWAPFALVGDGGG